MYVPGSWHRPQGGIASRNNPYLGTSGLQIHYRKH